MHRRAVLALTGPVLLGVLLAGCQGDDHPTATTAAPTDVLATAKQTLDGTTGVTFSLASSGVPPKVNGVTSAQGSGAISSTEPKFQGTIGATIKGITGTVDLISVGADTYMKFFTPDYNPVDLATLGAPNPSTLFNPDEGISTMLTATTGVTADGEVREGKEVLTSYTGKLPGSIVKHLLMLGTGTEEFDVAYGIADGKELRTATLKGPFYPGTTSTYVLTLSDYGKAVDISRP